MFEKFKRDNEQIYGEVQLLLQNEKYKNTESEIFSYLELAKQGDPEALYVFGMLHYFNESEEELEKAEVFLIASANKDYTDAQLELGILYEKKAEYEKATILFMEAASSGDEEANRIMLETPILNEIRKRIETERENRNLEERIKRSEERLERLEKFMDRELKTPDFGRENTPLPYTSLDKLDSLGNGIYNSDESKRREYFISEFTGYCKAYLSGLQEVAAGAAKAASGRKTSKASQISNVVLAPAFFAVNIASSSVAGSITGAVTNKVKEASSAYTERVQKGKDKIFTKSVSKLPKEEVDIIFSEAARELARVFSYQIKQLGKCDEKGDFTFANEIKRFAHIAAVRAFTDMLHQERYDHEHFEFNENRIIEGVICCPMIKDYSVFGDGLNSELHTVLEDTGFFKNDNNGERHNNWYANSVFISPGIRMREGSNSNHVYRRYFDLDGVSKYGFREICLPEVEKQIERRIKQANKITSGGSILQVVRKEEIDEKSHIHFNHKPQIELINKEEFLAYLSNHAYCCHKNINDHFNINRFARPVVIKCKADFTLITNGNNAVDLQGVNLSGSDLSGCKFSGLNLSGVYLAQTILVRANISNCDLRGANLERADLRLANLENIDIRGSEDRKRTVLENTKMTLSKTKDAKACRLTFVHGARFRGVRYGIDVAPSKDHFLYVATCATSQRGLFEQGDDSGVERYTA